ncbi:MAG: M48 family metalloprotease [Microthrixaceae bacterium]
METTESLDDATGRVVRSAMLMGLVPAVVLGAVLAFVHPLAGIAALVVVAAVWALVVSSRVRGARAALVAPLGGTPLATGAHPRLDNLLDGLAVTGGVSRPEVLVRDELTMNALVAADAEGATLVLTRGLVDGLGRVELEGVLANLLGRQRDGSARYATVVTALYGVGGRSARTLLRGLGDQRAVRSDLAAVDMTRYPPGLIAALGEMTRVGTEVPGVSDRSMPLWLAPPVASPGALDASLAASTMQPLALRIAVLEEL